MRSIRLQDTFLARRPPPPALGANLEQAVFFQLAQRDRTRYLVAFNARSSEVELVLISPDENVAPLVTSLSAQQLVMIMLPAVITSTEQLTRLALRDDPSWGVARLGDELPGLHAAPGSLVLLGGLNGGQPPGVGIALEIPARSLTQTDAGLAVLPGAHSCILWSPPGQLSALPAHDLTLLRDVDLNLLDTPPVSHQPESGFPSLVGHEASIVVPALEHTAMAVVSLRIRFGEGHQVALSIGLPISVQ